jgi:hypothetical protein
MALDETALSLASLAGRTVVTAAFTDVWAATKHGFARLLGLGDPARTQLAEQRLEQTHEQLAGVPATELEQVQEHVAVTWHTRLLDLLEEHPEVAPDLRMLVEQVQTQLAAGAVSAVGHGVATPLNPTGPGPANL